MKSINVPAQITTVEDKVAGNLTLTQIVLMACPVFINFAAYILLPRAFHLNTYKLCVMSIIAMLFCTSAIRIKEKLILQWSITLLSYFLRPRYYIFNKNTLYLRDEVRETTNIEDKKLKAKPSSTKTEGAKPKSNNAPLKPQALNFEFALQRKGKLDVYVTETN